jgi:tetratricopeptide (TPR) repeat protein
MLRHLLVSALLITMAPLIAFAEDPAPPPQPASGEQALRQLAAWKHSDARTALESVKAKEGTSASFKTAWGLLLAQEGKLDEALTELGAAASADTTDPAPVACRAEVLRWQKRYDESNAAFQQAHDRAKALVDKDPEDARARYYLGASLVRLKKYGEARTHLDAAEKAGFDKALARYQVGLSYTFEKGWEPAKASFDEVIATDERFAHAYYYRGRVWRELGRTDQMMVDMDTFLKLAPNSPESGIARSLLRAGGG